VIQSMMLQENGLQEYRIQNRLGHSFRRKIIDYLEKCRLEDGGYFFARVLPSSGKDTYFAVKSHLLLGLVPEQPELIANFFLSQMKEGWLYDVGGLFLASEVLTDLGFTTNELNRYAGSLILSVRNKEGGFGSQENLYIEVISELEKTYQAVKTLATIGVKFDREKIRDFTFGYLNSDGGYGKKGHSILSSTYYATAIHNVIGTDCRELVNTKTFLRKKEKSLQLLFIDELYWLTMALFNLGTAPGSFGSTANFVLNCQGSNGGFARATRAGISTLEYTYYALSILGRLGAV